MTSTQGQISTLQQSFAPASTPAVWNIHPQVMHYRVPIWDRLVQLSTGRYRLTVLGETESGRPFGSREDRDYVRHLSLVSRRIVGLNFYNWPQSCDLVRRETPDVVIVNVNPRNRACWRIPRICRSYGGASVAWTKVTSFSGLPGPILRAMKRRLFNRYDLFIVYGREARNELMQLGIAGDRIRVARNTIDTSNIFAHGDAMRREGDALRRNAGLQGKRILLMVGKMFPGKRHRDLVDAWPRLRVLDPNLVLLLIGRGPLSDELRSAALATDPERIRFIGSVPEGDDYRWIATSDVAIQPGKPGLFCNQSLALGVPTIVSDEPGPDTEFVIHHETGWRYPTGDLDAMVRCIREAIEDTALSQRIIERGIAIMRTEITIENMVTQIDATIEHALALARERRG